MFNPFDILPEWQREEIKRLTSIPKVKEEPKEEKKAPVETDKKPKTKKKEPEKPETPNQNQQSLF